MPEFCERGMGGATVTSLNNDETTISTNTVSRMEEVCASVADLSLLASSASTQSTINHVESSDEKMKSRHNAGHGLTKQIRIRRMTVVVLMG